MPDINFNLLPDEALLRAADFVNGVVPFGRTKWWEMVSAGKAPPPAINRHRATFWRWGDVRKWLHDYAKTA